MTRTCPYCESVVCEENFPDHLRDCIKEHAPPPAPPVGFQVKCQDVDCILFKGVNYPDVGNAELLAFAHENRFRELGSRHLVDVEDLSLAVPAPTSDPAGSAAGAKEADNG